MNQSTIKSAITNQTALKYIGSFALMLSVGVTIMAVGSVLTMISKTANENIQLGTILLVFWTVSPYICFFGVFFLLMRFTSVTRLPLIFYVISVLMFLGTLLGYAGTRVILGNRWSVYGLIFFVVPFYLHIGWFLLLAGSLISTRIMSNKNNRG